MVLRKISCQQLRSFLLRELGLCGSFKKGTQATQLVDALGTIQVDSIRVTGLRSHELSLLARVDDASLSYSELVYHQRRFIETHYPVHAVRYDLLRGFRAAYSQRRLYSAEDNEYIHRLMGEIETYIKEHGGVSAKDFESDRVPGGFSTIKATTKALERLLFDGRVMIEDRSPSFHRIFNLTKNVVPDLVDQPQMTESEYWDFLVASALEVLKVGTVKQIAERVRIHYGQWRKGMSIQTIRKHVREYLERTRAAGFKIENGDFDEYYWIPGNRLGKLEALPEAESCARMIPPLDNVLFSRERFKRLFDVAYLFEAYKPKEQRKYYYGLPLLYKGRIVGVLDLKLLDSALTIIAGELLGSPPERVIRQGLMRLALRVEATSIVSLPNLGSKWKTIYQI